MPIETSNNTITTANAVFSKQENGATLFLLVQENDGNWGLPGGAKEIDDESCAATLKRELQEELGLQASDYTVRETGVQRKFEYNHFESSRFGKHGIVQFFLAELRNAAAVKPSGELAGIAWCTKDEAISRFTFDYIREGFAEVLSAGSNTIEITDATPDDVQGVLAVQKETWLATYPNEEHGITREDILARDWGNPARAERWRKTMSGETPHRRIWVAKEGKRVVGFGGAEKGSAKNRLSAIYILPNYQKQGIGRGLVQKAFEWLGDDKDISVAVATYNKNAIDFYRKSGFAGEKDAPLSEVARFPSGKVMPEIEMTKSRRKN